MSLIQVDFSKNLGPIKPMHGVNNGPLTKNLSRDARPQFKEAAFPLPAFMTVSTPSVPANTSISRISSNTSGRIPRIPRPTTLH